VKKKFDAVELMRNARERLAREWAEKPRSEEIAYLQGKYGKLSERKKRRGSG